MNFCMYSPSFCWQYVDLHSAKTLIHPHPTTHPILSSPVSGEESARHGPYLPAYPILRATEFGLGIGSTCSSLN